MNHVPVCLLLCQGSFTTLWGEQHKMTLFFHYGYSTPESNPFNFEAPIRIKTWHSFFVEKKQGELIFLVPRYGGGWVIRVAPWQGPQFKRLKWDFCLERGFCALDYYVTPIFFYTSVYMAALPNSLFLLFIKLLNFMGAQYSCNCFTWLKKLFGEISQQKLHIFQK